MIQSLQQEQGHELQRLARTIHHSGLRAQFLYFGPRFVSDIESLRPHMNSSGRSDARTQQMDDTASDVQNVDGTVRMQRHRTVADLEAFYGALSRYIVYSTLGEGLGREQDSTRIQRASQWTRQNSSDPALGHRGH
jgi:hypothetical protein